MCCIVELKGLREDWDGFLEATLRSGITAPAYLLDGVGAVIF